LSNQDLALYSAVKPLTQDMLAAEAQELCCAVKQQTQVIDS